MRKSIYNLMTNNNTIENYVKSFSKSKDSENNRW